MRSLFAVGWVVAMVAVSACGPGSGNGGAADAGGGDAGVPETGGATCAAVKTWDTQVTRVDANDPNKNGPPLVAFDGAGNAMVVWERFDLGGSNAWTLWASERSAAGTWSTPAQIDGAGSAGLKVEPMPSLAVSGDGSAAVLFQQETDPGGADNASNPWYALYAPGAGWGAATPFFPATIAEQWTGHQYTRVAMDGKGNAVAVWGQDIGEKDASQPDFTLQVYAARMAKGQPWSSPVRLSNFLVNGTTDPPDVALAPNGDAIAVWGVEPGNSPIRMMAARLDGASGTWGAAQFIDQCTACASNEGIVSRVAMDASANAMAVWTQGQSGGTHAAYGARYAAASAAWSNAEQLDATLGTNLDADQVEVAFDGAGNATAVWVNVSNDPSHPNNIIANRWTSGAWTGPTPLDLQNPGYNTRPAIATDDLGDAMVVWDDQGSVWAEEYLASSESWGTQQHLDPQDSSAGFAVVGFAPGCPVALVAYQNATSQSGNNGAGIFAQMFR